MKEKTKAGRERPTSPESQRGLRLAQSLKSKAKIRSRRPKLPGEEDIALLFLFFPFSLLEESELRELKWHTQESQISLLISLLLDHMPPSQGMAPALSTQALVLQTSGSREPSPPSNPPPSLRGSASKIHRKYPTLPLVAPPGLEGQQQPPPWPPGLFLPLPTFCTQQPKGLKKANQLPTSVVQNPDCGLQAYPSLIYRPSPQAHASPPPTCALTTTLHSTPAAAGPRGLSGEQFPLV